MLAAGRCRTRPSPASSWSPSTPSKSTSATCLGKLGAANRTEAVARARELGLIPSAPRQRHPALPGGLHRGRRYAVAGSRSASRRSSCAWLGQVRLSACQADLLQPGQAVILHRSLSAAAGPRTYRTGRSAYRHSHGRLSSRPLRFSRDPRGGPVCHKLHRADRLGWGACAPGPVYRGRCATSLTALVPSDRASVYRGMCATTPERPGLPHRACGPQARLRDQGARMPGRPGCSPDPGRVLVIVDRHCPRAGRNDPRSCLTPGLPPAGSQSAAAGLVPGATLVTGSTRSARLRWSGGGQSWQADDNAARPAHPARVPVRTRPARTLVHQRYVRARRQRSRAATSTSCQPVSSAGPSSAALGPRFGHVPVAQKALSLPGKGLYLKLVAGGGV